ncbi:cadmium-translocating P-type ATPase [Bacillus aerolatus]|uniref:Cd(2+)-exporting ATPase n=1 Tax=Bacillus aerolatus TaxID=2653354 RepID=A0A6I1FBH8_9BACI|nr:heavy metal translocating P-type ATPase [Bacillus aerolatus]KAB7704370.1 cadmium-translocating P-type ATPase [Bacillus aerolatus]
MSDTSKKEPCCNTKPQSKTDESLSVQSKPIKLVPIDTLKKQPAGSCCASSSCSETQVPSATHNAENGAKGSCCASDTPCTATKTAQQHQGENEEAISLHEYRIQGMDCPACALTIEKSLVKMSGVKTIQVNYSTAKMQVAAGGDISPALIKKQVEKLGFKAESLDHNEKSQTFIIDGMDCGACAVTLEKHMKNVPTVEEVRVNFSTGKMHITHDLGVEAITKEVSNAGFEAALSTGRKNEVSVSKKGASTTTVSGILLALGFFGSFNGVSPALITVLYAASILVGGYKPARSAYYAVKSGSLDMNVLMMAAAIGAALIGEWFEGATVVWLFALGAALQNKSIERTRESIRGLMNLAPQEAWVKAGQNLSRKPVEAIQIGDTIVIKPGEKIPLDGEITAGSSTVNQAPITGESLPVDKQIKDIVYAGTVNENGSLEVKVTKLVKDTAIARIIHLVEEAQEQKAPTEAFIDRFAKIYTPIVFVLAIFVMVMPPLLGWGPWSEWLYKGLELLVVACPCALVISTPVAIVSAIGNAAKNGILIKGGTFLETAGAINVIAFDKTGTLTEGKPKVSGLYTVNGTEAELLAVARTIEEHSQHPIASAIVTSASERGISALGGEDFTAIAGKGAKATIDGSDHFAGNPKLFQELNVSLGEMESRIQSLQEEGNTLVIVGTRSTIFGIIAVSDTIRTATAKALKDMKSVGVEQIVMLTGDNAGTAKKISDEAGVDRFFAELMPEDKVQAVKQLQNEGKIVAMVGDGINDAPALATADLGIAMGGAGTDTAMETADIVLMADNLEKLPHTVKLSRKALSVIKQNIWFSLLTKLAALILIFTGDLTLWLAVLSDTGAALLVILNSMRLLRLKS